MKKKWLWLLVLVLFLSCATIWVRDAVWRRHEESFRRHVHYWLENEATHIIIYKNYRDPRGKWTDIEFFDPSADSLLVIDQMKLVPARSLRSENEPLIFISMTTGGSVGEPYGFYLGQTKDRGWIELPDGQSDPWKKYELAPETCRALKKRISELEKKVKADSEAEGTKNSQ